MKMFSVLQLALGLFVLTSATSTDSRKKLRRAHVAKDVDDDADDAGDDDADQAASPVPAPPMAAPVAAPASAPAVQVTLPAEGEEGVEMHEMMEEAETMLDHHNVTDPAEEHKEELAGIIFEEEVLQNKLDDIEDKDYEAKIEKEEKPVGNETSPGLAKMLGEMRVEMHEFALPFYKKVLKEKIQKLEHEQHELIGDIKDDTEEEKGEIKETKLKEPEKKMKAKSKSKAGVSNNTIFICLGAVAILAGAVFFLSKGRSRE